MNGGRLDEKVVFVALASMLFSSALLPLRCPCMCMLVPVVCSAAGNSSRDVLQSHIDALPVVFYPAGPPGPKPWDLMPKITAPMLVVWGDTDTFTPLDGPVGQYFKGLAGIRDKTDFLLLRDVGHCPQDDRPELLHETLLPWLKKALSAAASG